jgi:hypothetical protein
MIEIELLLVVIVAALCVIAYRLGKANEFLKDLLASSRRKSEPRREIEEEPLPPPLTLDDPPTRARRGSDHIASR